ncbi:hypothetical protein [Campylobacter troglodytis]|uniref:hypothetical protein n=1 Tax=Campylobacter troglodytis TaxID=654363 RepID=UPI00163C5EEE|nr:hypothetical protein [Campylobacter troglodytis]
MKIILIGGSNSVLKQGLKKGLARTEDFLSLALGNTSSLQNLYELIRHKGLIEEVGLIVSESNVNDLAACKSLSLDIVCKNIDLFYEVLASFKARVLVLILPSNEFFNEHINNCHRKNINSYGFNFVDLDLYFKENKLESLTELFGAHPLPRAMQLLGENIVRNLANFKAHKITKHSHSFKLFVPLNLRSLRQSNSVFNEEVFRLDSAKSLSLKGYEGYELLGIHSWNEDKKQDYKLSLASSNLELKNKDKELNFKISTLNAFYDLGEQFIIDEETIIKTVKKEEDELAYTDLISLFLFKRGLNLSKALSCEAKNCAFLIPDFKLYKEIIRQYEETKSFQEESFLERNLKDIEDFIKQRGLEEECLAFLNSRSKQEGALALIKNDPAYILGELIIKHSKHKIQRLLLPLILSRAKKKLVKTKRQNLYQYKDYMQALRAKNHLAYKLGKAYLKACKKPFFTRYFSLARKLKKIAKKHKSVV